MTNERSHIAQAAEIIQQRVKNFTPKVGIILGSGLGALADRIENAICIPYEELPDFGHCSVEGHAGQMVLGYLQGVPVACLKGRVHYYEGISNQRVQSLVRTLKVLGCEILFATNAAGSLRPEVGPGSLMMVTDHINFQGCNPLAGENNPDFGPRFFSMDHAYDLNLQEKLRQSATALNLTLHEGVYLATLGPCFETPAEIRAFKVWGADAVGMSTAPEVIVARHCGLRVAVVSAITNLAAGLGNHDLSHTETLYYADIISQDMIRLAEHFVASLELA